MRRVRIVLSRLRGILAGRRLDRELQDEIEGHLAEAIEDFVTQGLSPEEARRAALCSFGGVTQTIETHRDARGWPWFESILRDVRRAIRLLRRSPAVTAAAVLSLALGMGGTTTMFSLVNGLMLRPLPVQNPERLVSIVAGEETNSWKMPVWERLRDRAGLFDGLFAWDARSLDLAERGESRPVSGLLVSGSFFDVLGLSPQAGRLLRRTDDVEGGGSDGPAAVISAGFWRHQFGAAPDVVGRTLRVNGASVTIVGIAPASFFGPEVGRSFDVAVPLAIAPLFAPESPPEMAFHNLWLSIMARLKPGRDAAGATVALHTVMPGVLEAAEASLPRYMRLPASLRASMATARVEPAPGGPSLVRDQYDRSVVTVTAIAVAVLLIACVNLANLFLARGEARRRELAIAMALGATRLRLVRQLVIEGLVLSALGAAGGLAIAMWAAPVLIGEFSSARHAVTMALPIDWRLLGLTGLTAIATALIFSVLPALRVTGLGPGSTLSGARVAGHDRQAGRAHGVLVTVQVALSLVLAVSAALLVATFIRLHRYDLGRRGGIRDRGDAGLVRDDGRPAAAWPRLQLG
jgi:predicted permease